MNSRGWATPTLLFLLTFALAALYGWRTPRWQAPDEPAHYAYVQAIATTGLPPVLEARCYNEAYKNALVSSNFAQEPDLARFCYEGHQPPLFYYLAAPVYLLTDGSLLALRLLCAAIGAGVAPLAWAIARAAGADRALAAATGALVALVPQHLAMLGSLNNDALTFLLVALAAGQMVRLLRPPIAAAGRAWLTLALLIGLALLTKTLAWIVLPLAALTVLFTENQKAKGKNQKAKGTATENQKAKGKRQTGYDTACEAKGTAGHEPILASTGVVHPTLHTPHSTLHTPHSTLHTPHPTSHIPHPAWLAVAALLILPWWARNVAVYGGADVMGLQRHDEIAVNQPRTAARVAEVGLAETVETGLATTFHSFWGQFGWMKAPLQAGEYRVLAAFSVVAVAGLAGWGWRRGWRAWGLDGRALALFAAWAAGSAALLVYYNLEFVQYQGRYLFPALTPLAFFLMVGLGAWLPARGRWLAWNALLAFLLYLNALAIGERLPGMAGY